MGFMSSAAEFGNASRAILPIMKDPKSTLRKKRSALNMMVNELTDGTFKSGFVIKQIMTIINMKEEVCREYKDTKAQVDSILGWLPRMKQHRKKLEKEVGKHRKQCGLKV